MIDKKSIIHIDRYVKQDIIDHIKPNKVVVIYGPRRVGKTTLVKEIAEKLPEKALYITGDDIDMQQILSVQSVENINRVIGMKRMIIIDEAQRIPSIGHTLKLMVDMIPGIKVIATGSSSFELSHQVGEPLVGRAWRYTLYPIAQLELQANETPFESSQQLQSRLIFGAYPEVLLTKGEREKRELLNSIIDGALFKDVFMLEGVKKPAKITQLAQLIALQIGNQVSLSELSRALSINFATVERYLDLLEKTFVIVRVYGFSRNLRKEITKTCRYYFWDNGIRNALINNFNPITIRTDIGQLWENYVFIERMKKRTYQHIYSNIYFWRTHDRQEIDMVEERGGKLYGIECKWSPKKLAAPRDWRKRYPEAEFMVVNRENYLDFIA